MKKHANILLPSIFALALCLRLAGINHGLPFVFHPDEPTVVRTALSIRHFPNPGHFDWPHLFMYLNFAVFAVFGQFRKLIEFLGYRPSVVTLFPMIWEDPTIYYLITRSFSAILGALTVVPIYLAGRDTFGRRAGILAAITFAILPFHVWHSHYALIDVPMLFFSAWGVMYALNILRRKETNDYAGAGFYIGLSASTKYNGALTAIAVPIAHVLRVIKNKEKLFDIKSFGSLFISFITCIIGFLIGTPFALLDSSTFLRTDGPKGALWQFQNVGDQPFSKRIPEFFNAIIFKVSDDLGYTILIGFFLVLLLLIVRKLKKRTYEEDFSLWFLVITGIALLLYVSGLSRSRSHYFFVAYPYIVLAFGYLLDYTMQKLDPRNSIIGLAIFALGLGLPMFLSVQNAFIFYRSDTRAVLYNWIKPLVKPGDRIFYNKSNLSPVIDKFDNPKAKTPPSTNNPVNGLWFISYEKGEDVKQVYIRQYKGKMTKVVNVSNSYRLGPEIEVYRLYSE